MMNHETRRRFLQTQSSGLVGVVALGWATRAESAEEPSPQTCDQPKSEPKRERKRPIAGDLVQKFVLAGHRDLDEVKQLLEDEPGLINACWDWGGGDFETALGGAAHVGLPDVANYLLGQGARLDLFAAAMLGKLEVIQAAVAVFPEIMKVPGPHGIPLIAHAERGGEAAIEVVEFLKELKESRSLDLLGADTECR